MARHHEDALRRILSSPQGMIIVTGPTASGKSTTLYSSLNTVASPSKSMVAVEDPIEYMLEGIIQVQVSPGSGLTVPAMLQAILRQNPNVIMIGEILDEETADIALRAAQIGHLVLTTLRTNDSIDAIIRLRSLGVAPNLLASINGIVGQRLLRTLCTCRKEVDATSDYRRSLKAMNFMEEVSKMYAREGCSRCDNTGYRGRVALFELLLPDGAVREAIQTEKQADQIRRTLAESGFRSMRQDAVDKVLQGVTALEEVLRVLPAAN